MSVRRLKMPTVNMKCFYCDDYHVKCNGKSKACDKFPGTPDKKVILIKEE
jgi:hypothetical protein